MLNNKKGLKLKTTLIMFVCLLVGLSCASLFACRENRNNNAHNLSIETIASSQVDENVQSSSFTMKWSKESENKIIKPMTITGNTTSTSGAYHIEYTGLTSSSTLSGGTTITVSGSGSTYTLAFSGSTTGTITITIHNGYKLDSISFGYEDDSNDDSHVEKWAWTTLSSDNDITTEEMDPNYTGELSFKINTTETTQTLNLYYLNDSGTYSYQTGTYKVNSDSLNVDSEVTKPTLSGGRVVAEWLFNASVAGVSPEGTTISKDNVDFTLATDENGVVSYTNQAGHTLYRIASVKGYGKLSQDGNNPIVVAKITDVHSITIKNGVSDWQEVKDDQALYGVETTAGDSDTTPTTIVNLQISNADAYAYPFMNGQGLAFKQKSYYTSSNFSGYYVYNYGYYITGYKISYDYNSKTYQISYNGKYDKEEVSDSITAIDIANFYDTEGNATTTFKELSAYLDCLFAGMKVDPTITITPTWAKQSFAVKYGGSSLATGLKIGDIYDLDEQTSNGQTMVAYESGEQLIAQSGVWNYCTGTAPDIYVYDTTGKTYTVSVTPVFVDNIYQITLNGVKVSSTNTYTLTNNCGYTFKTDDNTNYTSAEYTFKDYSYSGYSFSAWSNSLYLLMDDYITYLVGRKTAYEAGIDGDKNNDFDIFRKVYYSTGTVSTTNDNDTLTTSSTPTFHIYLAHNQEYSVPAFEHEYKNLIYWTAGINAFTTTKYDSKWLGEITKNSCAIPEGNKWLYSYGTTLSPYYLHRLVLYYEKFDVAGSASGSYNGESSSNWYGEYTPNTICETTPSSGYNAVTFGYWMFNADVALADGWQGTGTDNTIILESLSTTEEGYFTSEQLESIKGKITITKDSVSLTMYVISKNPFHNYYYISNLQGTGIVTQSSTNPFLTAKWSTIYDLTINVGKNEKTEWDDYSPSELNDLRGVYSKIGENDESGGISTSFIIAHNNKYQYGFMASEYTTNAGDTYGLSFYTHNDFGDNPSQSIACYAGSNYYYVYNYGYYISGWYLRLDTSHWLTYNGKTWALSESENHINISNLTSKDQNLATLSSLAEQADEYFAYELGSRSLTIYPKWEEVNIKAQYSETTTDAAGQSSTTTYDIVTTTFNSTYLAEQMSPPTGKSLFCYEWGDEGSGKYIASVNNNGSSGKWNYYSIPTKAFSYGVFNSYAYTLQVTPVFVDNIYQITLNGVKVSSENTYTLTGDCDYTFKTNGNTNYPSDTYTFEDSYSGYSFSAWNTSYLLMDNYITYLVGRKTTYETGIDGDKNNDFDIFRKVYYSNGTVSTTTKDNDTLTTSSTPTFHIYLANGQKTGEMPVFNKDYYELIMWKNDGSRTETCIDSDCANSKKDSNNESQPESSGTHAYITHKYTYQIHSAEIDDFVYHSTDSGTIVKQTAGANTTENSSDDKFDYYNYIWYYSDGGQAFTTHYFRKYYELDIQTLFGNVEDNIIARKGYVYVNINDLVAQSDSSVADMGGEYVVIAKLNTSSSPEQYEMVIYEVNSAYTYLYSELSETSQSPADVYEDDTKLKNGHLKLYEGCDITFNVQDQSKDPTAMASGEFDEMIGYKFDSDIGITQSVTETIIDNLGANYLFDPNNKSEYAHNATASEISGLGLQSGDVIEIKVPFVKIEYTFVFTLDDTTAGDLKVTCNTSTSDYKKTYTLENKVVDDVMSVTYYAYAGFTLQENAFVITNAANSGDFTLQTFVDTETHSLEGDQKYILDDDTTDANYKLYGTWLRLNFYNDGDYSLDRNGNSSTITIQTTPIEFTFGVKVYTSDNGFTALKNASDNDVLYNLGTFALTANSATGTTPSFASVLTEEAVEGENRYWYTYNGTTYALLSSRMFFPDNSTTTTDNHYTTYDFLLNSGCDKTFVLTPRIISNMVNTYSSGQIISSNDRNIYIMLEVRELFTITMQAEKLDGDTNSTTRTTTISNGTKNSASHTLSSDSDFTTTETIYTYKDLTNTLSSTFDSKRYTDVKYYLGGELLNTNSFTVEDDSTLTIKYVPSTLNIVYEYALEDENGNMVIKSYDELSGFLTDNHTGISASGWVIGRTFTYQLICINTDYDVSVTIHNEHYDMVDSAVNCPYTVVDSDYDYEKITVRTELKLKDNSKIYVKFQLTDSSKACLGDAYGTFEVYEESGWCSELYERYISGYNGTRVNVSYDDCNPFGMIAGDFGEITSLSKHTSKTASEDTIAKFNTLITLFNTYIDEGASTNFTTQAFNIYKESSLCSFTDIADASKSALVGINKDFGNQDLLVNMATLFGYQDVDSFKADATEIATTYSTYYETEGYDALQNGCFEDSNTYVFPMVIKNDTTVVLTYLFVTETDVYLWVNDTDSLEAATDTTKQIDNKLYCKNILFVTGPESEPKATASNNETAEVTIFKGRRVYFTISLNAGYDFVGIKHGTGDITTPTFVANNGYQVILSYNPDEDTGTYYIMIDKISISATLNTTDSEGTALKGTYLINGKTVLDKTLYVGKTIDFTYAEVNQERLDYFYYGGDEGNVVTDADPSQSNIQFTITSDLIEDYATNNVLYGTTIEFGIKTVNRYKLNLNVVNSQYLSELTLTYNNGSSDVEYVQGTYVDDGTIITINAKTIVPEKYKITYNNGAAVYELINTTETLTADVTSLLTVAPEQFNVSIDENVYKTLTDINNATPQDETNTINGYDVSKTYDYNVKTTIEFNKVVEDRELYEIYISGNDDKYTSDGIVIRIEGNSYKAYLNDGSETEIKLSGYDLTIQITSYGTVKLTYIPSNDITIKLDYKLYKLIES